MFCDGTQGHAVLPAVLFFFLAFLLLSLGSGATAVLRFLKNVAQSKRIDSALALITGVYFLPA